MQFWAVGLTRCRREEPRQGVLRSRCSSGPWAWLAADERNPVKVKIEQLHVGTEFIFSSYDCYKPVCLKCARGLDIFYFYVCKLYFIGGCTQSSPACFCTEWSCIGMSRLFSFVSPGEWQNERMYVCCLCFPSVKNRKGDFHKAHYEYRNCHNSCFLPARHSLPGMTEITHWWQSYRSVVPYTICVCLFGHSCTWSVPHYSWMCLRFELAPAVYSCTLL
jgi:hypothetical protein